MRALGATFGEQARRINRVARRRRSSRRFKFWLDVQTKADRCELCSRYRRALRNGTAHGKHKPVGGGVQDQAELVGFGIATGGAVGSKLALVQLDEVLGVSPRTVEGLVKMLGAGLE